MAKIKQFEAFTKIVVTYLKNWVYVCHVPPNPISSSNGWEELNLIVILLVTNILQHVLKVDSNPVPIQ